MDYKSELMQAGVNYANAIQRFHNNEAMYFKYLFRLPDDILVSEAMKYFEENNFEAARTTIHTLKGLLGNLSIDELFAISTEMMDKFRKEEYEDARDIFINDFLCKYYTVIEAVRDVMETKKY